MSCILRVYRLTGLWISPLQCQNFPFWFSDFYLLHGNGNGREDLLAQIICCEFELFYIVYKVVLGAREMGSFSQEGYLFQH